PEDLLLRDRVLFLHVRKDGRLYEVALVERAAGDPAAAAFGFAALLASDPDVAQHRLHLRLIDARADIDSRLHAIAHLQLPGALHHGGHEALVDGVLDDGAAGGGALLPGREEGCVDDVLHGGAEVRIGQHDGRILAAHFELNAQPPPGRFSVQPVADLA